MDYLKHAFPTQTPQREPIPGETQVKNEAGGYVYEVDPWERLDRFLILGTEGPTHYASERARTVKESVVLVELLKQDGPRVVARILDISHGGRAAKNDAAVFALAVAAKLGDEKTKREAYKVMPAVCRTGTDFFSWLEQTEKQSLSGRGWRRAIGRWYLEKDPHQLAVQLTKYRSRKGWTHRDALRKAHPVPKDGWQAQALAWAARKESKVVDERISAIDGALALPPELKLIRSFTALQQPEVTKQVVLDIIGAEKALTWEHVPDRFLKDPEVWEALLHGGLPIRALLRNLGRLGAIGLLKPLSAGAKTVVERLSVDRDVLRKARIHPMHVLVALRQYSQGAGDKGSLKWAPVAQVLSALDSLFYQAFAAVDPSGKRFLLALDVSSSMSGGQVCGASITPCEASAVMAMVTARSEPEYHIVGFTHTLKEIPITAFSTLAEATRLAQDGNFGNTDCAQPMLYAQKRKLEVDCFVVYTDNQAWCGGIHPSQALRSYRSVLQRPRAKSVVVAMTAGGFSIADPKDAGMLDVVGFDSMTPQVISAFAAG